MKRYIIILLTISIMLPLLITYSCAAPSDNANEKQVATVERGDIEISVTADGNTEIPKGFQKRDAYLGFGTSSIVQDIFVETGDVVYAGQLLAKLDDSVQILNIQKAQYDVELALTQLAEKIYPSIMGYPHYYPSTSSLLYVEQAQNELTKAQAYMQKNDFSEASYNIRIALHDLEQSKLTLQKPITDANTYPDIAEIYINHEYYKEWPSQYYPAIPDAIAFLEDEIKDIQRIYDLIINKDNMVALSEITSILDNYKVTYETVNRACGKIVRTGIYYPDASTTLSILDQVNDSLAEMQKMIKEGKGNTKEFGEKLRIVQHDIEVGRKILDDNELLLKTGVNMNVLRQNNLNLQEAEIALELAKKNLMYTEIIAPFDGIIDDIFITENEWYLAAPGFSTTLTTSTSGSGTEASAASGASSSNALHLVSVTKVEMRGLIDEVDIYKKVNEGNRAIIRNIDALPGMEFEGVVKYISPVSVNTGGVVNFPVIVSFDMGSLIAKAGLSATAEIIVDSRENVLYIPNGALKGATDNYYVEVMVDKEKGITEQRNIAIGLQNDIYTEIIAGLVEGEEVVVERVRPTKSIF